MLRTRRIFTCLCLATLTLFGNVGMAAAKEADWTFLLYLASDNNLEAAQLLDLQEMIEAGGSDRVRIVALVDRSEKDDQALGYSAAGVGQLANWTTGKLVEIQQGRLAQLADWGEVNMGDPATLKRFLDTGMKHAPAGKYALVFGDHGAGWPGVCGDESHHNDRLTMTEIYETLKSLPRAASRFELIGFDACLMGNLECAFSIAPFAKIMVASEELEPGYGWHYTPLFQRVVAEPSLSGAEVGKIIVETFDDFYRKSSSNSIRNAGIGTTLSAVDLTKLDAVLKALQTLSKACQADLTENGRSTWLSLADARAHSEEFGLKDAQGNGMGLIDLGHLVKRIRTQFTEGPIDVAARALEKSLKAMVVANRHGQGRTHAHGISIFFPADRDQLAGDDAEEKSDDAKADRGTKDVDAYLDAYSQTLFAKGNPWLNFVTEFTVAAANDTEDPVLGEIEASATRIAPGETASFTADIEADDVETISFVLAKRHGDLQVVIGELPGTRDDEGHVSDEWDGKWFTLKAGDKEFICPVIGLEEAEPEEDDDSADPKPDADSADRNEYVIEVPAQIQRRNKNTWIDVSLFFYVDLDEDEITGEFVYAFQETKNGPTEVSLKTGDKVRPVFVMVSDEGKETHMTSDDESEIIELDDPDDLSVGSMAVPAGHYEVGFQVYDYSENYAEQFVEVEVTE